MIDLVNNRQFLWSFKIIYIVWTIKYYKGYYTLDILYIFFIAFISSFYTFKFFISP